MSIAGVCQATYLLSNSVQPIVQTAQAATAALSGLCGDLADNGRKWEKIRRLLRSWQERPDEAGDNEIEPPSILSILVADRIATGLAERDIEAFDRVVPTGDGGIAFESSDGDIHEVIEIESDGACEWKIFDDCRLQERRPLSFFAEPE